LFKHFVPRFSLKVHTVTVGLFALMCGVFIR
jgi:hypothetical protein